MHNSISNLIQIYLSVSNSWIVCLQVADYHIYEMDVRVYMCILLIPFMLINSVKNLKFLAPFSTLANVVTVISFSLIGYYLLTDIPSLSERAIVAPYKKMPLFFGTVLFAMEAIGVVSN